MKRTLLFFIILIPFVAKAQQDYKIYSVQGDVRLLHTSETTWEIAQPQDYVSLDDVIYVKKGGSVSVLEVKSNRIYVSDKTGKMTVGKRMGKALNSSLKIWRKGLHQELDRSITKQKDSEMNYISAATTVRGDSIYSLYDTLYAYILDFSIDTTCRETLERGGICVSECGTGINITRKQLTDDSFGIIIKNEGDKTFFCNVVSVHDSHPVLCYYFEDWDLIPLYPKRTIDLSAFPLSTKGEYILFACEKNMYIDLLENIFNNDPILSTCHSEKISLMKFVIRAE